MTPQPNHSNDRSSRQSPSGRPARALRDDSRGVTELLGLMLAFALVMSVVTLVQVSAVPSWNSQVEFDHSQRVHGEMAAFDEAVARTAVSGVSEPVTITRGATYPTRMGLLNPPAASGSVATSEAAPLVVRNAVATDDSAAYWSGGDHTFSAQSFRYTPSYNYQAEGALVHEGVVLYSQYPDGAVIGQTQSLLNGNRITLTLVNGSVSEAGLDSTTVEVRPISVSTDTVPVTGDGATIDIVLPSALPATEWADLLADEPHFVSATQTGAAAVTISLDGSVTYDLRVAKVGVGTRPDTSGDDAAYLVGTEGVGVIQENSHGTLVVQVRDRYNNPVEGEQVSAALVADGVATDAISAQGQADDELVGLVTDSDGEVAIRYDVGAVSGANVDTTVRVSLGATAPSTDASDDFDTAVPENYEFTQRVVNTDGSGVTVAANVGAAINPATSGSLKLTGATVSNGGNDVVTVTFEVKDWQSGDAEKTVSGLRLNTYANDDSGNSDKGEPNAVVVSDGDGSGATPAIGGDFVSAGFETKNGLLTLDFDFDGPNKMKVTSSDYFVVSMEFSDGTYGTYFVSPSN